MSTMPVVGSEWIETKRPGRFIRVESTDDERQMLVVQSLTAHNVRPQKHGSLMTLKNFHKRFSPVPDMGDGTAPPEENFWDDRTTPNAYGQQDSERDMAERRKVMEELGQVIAQSFYAMEAGEPPDHDIEVNSGHMQLAFDVMNAGYRKPPTKGGPWTSHGHVIPGVTVAGEGRPAVARCGGPGLCSKCSLEAVTKIPRRS